MDIPREDFIQMLMLGKLPSTGAEPERYERPMMEFLASIGKLRFGHKLGHIWGQTRRHD